VADITPEQVRDLLVATQDYLAIAEAATHGRDTLGHTFLDVARHAKVGLRDIVAITGLHTSTIRAAIRRAAGPGLSDKWEQPELEPSGPGPARDVHPEPAPTVYWPAATVAL